MTTPAKTETAAKKNVQKLQRAIVDGLEDVKAQDIRVFNTEHLSPLFERVIIASGTSNRQTKALASSVRDAVREAGFDKPRTEGEENGEWIIVDCGTAVAHIMQPAIRQYYHLEEIWGDTPVTLKSAAGDKSAAAPATRRKRTAEPAAAAGADAPAAPAPRKRAARKTAAVADAVEQDSVSPARAASKAAAGRKSSARGTAARSASTGDAPAPGTAAAKAPARKPAGAAADGAPRKAPARKRIPTVVVGAPARKAGAGRKTAARKTAR